MSGMPWEIAHKHIARLFDIAEGAKAEILKSEKTNDVEQFKAQLKIMGETLRILSRVLEA